jgi:hypothetical protein
MSVGGILTFTAGIALGASAFVPLAGWALTGWRRELRAHRLTVDQLDDQADQTTLATDALLMARQVAAKDAALAASLNRGLLFRITELSRQVNELMPLADKGRRREAQLLKHDRKRGRKAAPGEAA